MPERGFTPQLPVADLLVKVLDRARFFCIVSAWVAWGCGGPNHQHKNRLGFAFWFWGCCGGVGVLGVLRGGGCLAGVVGGVGLVGWGFLGGGGCLWFGFGCGFGGVGGGGRVVLGVAGGCGLLGFEGGAVGGGGSIGGGGGSGFVAGLGLGVGVFGYVPGWGVGGGVCVVVVGWVSGGEGGRGVGRWGGGPSTKYTQ